MKSTLKKPFDWVYQVLWRVFAPEALLTDEDRAEAERFRKENPDKPYSKPARWRSGL